MKPLKVVQIGMGHDHATGIFDSILALPKYYEVLGYAVPFEEEELCAEKIKGYEEQGIKRYSVEEALSLPGLEGAIIETEEKNLTKYAQIAADFGLHIHMDKPGGFCLADYEKLIETVKAKKLAFSTGYMYRFNPKIQEALEKVKKGDLGEIYSVEAHMDCEHPVDKRKWLGTLPGGMMFYLGCHLVDLVYRIQGEPLEVIPCNASLIGDGAEDFSMAVYRFEKGYSYIKSCAAEPGGFLRRQLVICGEKGTIEIRPIEVHNLAGAVGRRMMTSHMYESYESLDKNDNYEFNWLEEPHKSSARLYNRYDDMMINYVRIARGEIENPYTYDYEFEVYKLLLRSCGVKI